MAEEGSPRVLLESKDRDARRAPLSLCVSEETAHYCLLCTASAAEPRCCSDAVALCSADG